MTDENLVALSEEENALVIVVADEEIAFRPPLEESMSDTQIAMFAAMVRILRGDEMFVRKMVHWYLSNDIDLRYYTQSKTN